MTKPVTPAVWIIDDDDDDQLFISTAFINNQPSISVLSIRDGTELIPLLQQCEVLPRLILLDVNMPQINGFTLLEKLRSMSAFAHLPVIMFTTSSEDKDRKRSMELGADHFIIKPNFYEELELLAQRLSLQWQLA